MGKRGPIPKAEALKALSGVSPLTKSIVADLQKDFDPPKCPVHFRADEKRIWKETLDLLRDKKILERLDQSILSAYCYSVVKWRKAEKELAKIEKDKVESMFLINGATGTKIANPLLTISRRFASDMVTYAAQLGMTPAARLRVQIADGPQKKTNPFKRLKGLKASDDKGLDQDSKGLCHVFDPEEEQD